MALDRFSSPQSSPPSSSPTPFDASRPVDTTSNYAASIQDAAAETSETDNQRRVLVIESDIESADLIIALLENEGYKVEIATDGQYGLMLADNFEPHVILLALSLPGMSGYEVTQILRNEPRYAQRFRFTRIFYLTSKDHMLQKRFNSLPGTPMSDYIFKPVDIPELIDKVSRAFSDLPQASPDS
jgi:CheY-like chemotaxis protein